MSTPAELANPTLTWNLRSRRRRGARIPLHGQRAAGGQHRRRDGRPGRLADGVAPRGVRRAHALDDGLPGRRRRHAAGGAGGVGLLPVLWRRRPGDRALLLERAEQLERAVGGHRRACRRSRWASASCSSASTAGCSATWRTCCSATSSGSATARCCCCSPWRPARSRRSACWRRPLLFASVDADVAARAGLPVRALSFAFLLLLGLAVAATSQITGVLLVFALLVTPAATAQALTARPLAEPRAERRAGTACRLAGTRHRLLLGLSGRLLHHDDLLRDLPARARALLRARAAGARPSATAGPPRRSRRG